MGNRLLRELEGPQGEIPVGQDEEDFTTATPAAITHIPQDQKPIWTPVEVVPELDSRTPDPRGDLTEGGDEEDGRSVSLPEEERRQEVPEATVDKDEFAQLQRLVVDLNSEREALKDEVRRLNEKIKVEGAEWQQFQRDMHLAVTVADRLRLEAETEMEVLRARLEEEAGKGSALQEGLERKQRCHVDVVDGQENQALPDSLADGPQGPNGIKYRPHLDSNPSSGGPLTSEGRTAPCGDRKESEDPLRWEASPSDVTGVRGEGNRERLKMQQNEAAAGPSATSSIETHVNRPSYEKVRETLSDLVKRSGGSKRNTLLTWCKTKTTGYPNIEITNFSSSWSDGLAFCALLHTYLPDQIPYRELHASRKERNLRLAFNVLRSVGIKTTMDVEVLMRGDCHWQDVLILVESVYNHFET